MSGAFADLAAKAGISAEQAQQGIDAVVSALRDKLPAADAARVEQSVPATPAPAEGAGVLGTIKSLGGGLLGGGGGLLAKLAALGLSPAQIARFLPTALGFLKDKLPANIYEKVAAAMPAVDRS